MLVEMKHRLFIALVSAASGLATDASACRAFPQPAYVATSAHAAVVVAVLTAEPVGKVQQWQPWKARGRLVRVVSGSPLRTEFRFDNSGENSSCDTEFAVPRPGERWVLYLQRSDTGQWFRPRAYPVAFMLRHDRRLAAADTR